MKWHGNVLLSAPATFTLLPPPHRDMSKGSHYHVFRYTKYYHKMAGAELVLDLLNDPDVQDVLKVKAHT
jgi:hypothetical protein